MSRMTLRLPESLHQTLKQQAQREGVSLNHYIVYCLTRLITVVDVDDQKRRFQELTSRYPQNEAEAALRDVLAQRV